MKKYLLLIILALTVSVARAEFNRLVFRTLDGEERSVGLTDLNITFANGEMLANSDGEYLNIALASLKSMEFSNNPTSVDVVVAEENIACKVTVYLPDGKLQGVYDSVTSALTALPGGTYILKAENGFTSKISINR